MVTIKWMVSGEECIPKGSASIHPLVCMGSAEVGGCTVDARTAVAGGLHAVRYFTHHHLPASSALTGIGDTKEHYGMPSTCMYLGDAVEVYHARLARAWSLLMVVKPARCRPYGVGGGHVDVAFARVRTKDQLPLAIVERREWIDHLGCMK